MAVVLPRFERGHVVPVLRRGSWRWTRAARMRSARRFAGRVPPRGAARRFAGRVPPRCAARKCVADQAGASDKLIACNPSCRDGTPRYRGDMGHMGSLLFRYGSGFFMISASALELRAGARLLLDAASFQVAAGDKIGLVGRNGAGKTTLARVLAGESAPAAGTVRRSRSVTYLPQDTMVGDLDALAMDRVLAARGLDELMARLRGAAGQM